MFCDKLKILRTSQRISQRELAERIGVNKSIISFYENGERFPSYDVLVRIAAIFHVTTDYLLDVERGQSIDVTGLSDDDIAAVRGIVDALKRKPK